jgi:riboflavin synthase
MVFSGIVETKGNIVSVTNIHEAVSSGIRIVIEPENPEFLSEGVTLGCSIAVNGTCLTVTKFNAMTFTVEIAPETLRKTSFCLTQVGDDVNLERALKVDDRNSGHTVQGHVDGIGVIESIVPDGVSLRVRISTACLGESDKEKRYMQSLIVPKGFIAVDGASLTICEVDRRERWFTLMLIPHSREVLKPWVVNRHVNLELDCLAKYVSSTLLNMVDPLLNENKTRIKTVEILSGLSLVIASICFGLALRRFRL